MALTFGRWMALAIGLAVLSGAVLLRRSTSGVEPVSIGRDSLWRATLRATGEVSGAAQRLRALELMDSVQRSRPTGDTTRLLVDARLPRNIQDPFRGLASRSEIFASGARHPTRVIVVRDLLDSLRGVDVTFGFETGHYILPSDPGDACTVLIRVRPLSRRRFSYSRWAESLERRTATATFGGPCSWYESFGSPGPHVRQWLDRGGWRFATYGPATTDSTPWRAFGWTWYRNMPADARLRYFMSLGGYRCATGDASRCAHEVLFASSEGVTVGRVRDRDMFGWRGSYAPLGPRQHELLAGMVAAVGPERFARFWQSDEPVADAFQRHLGEDIGAWTLRWVRRTYGEEQRRGPGVQLSGVLFGITIGAAALAAALVKRRRRELA